MGGLLTAQTPSLPRSPSEAFGTETRRIEEDAIGPSRPQTRGAADPQSASADNETVSPPTPQPVVLPGADETAFHFETIRWVGDVALLDELNLRETLEPALLSASIRRSELRALLDRVNAQLVDMGYYIAAIRPIAPAPGDKTLVLHVDQGRIGKARFYAMPDSESRNTHRDIPESARKPYEGRYYSEAQLRRRLYSQLQTDGVFNYFDFRRGVLEINQSQMLTMDSHLRLRREQQPLPRTYLDYDFFVEDRRPLLFSATFDNSGTSETEDFRLTLTAQHSNLTHRDDVLTLSLPLSVPDTSVLRAVSLGYSLPHQIGKGGGMSVFGGYSELNVDEIVPELGLEGTGIFGGVRSFQHLVDTRKSSLNVSMGLTYRQNDDSFVFDDVTADENRSVEVLPLSLGLSYVRKDPDALGGRTFASVLVSHNLGDALGISEQLSFDNQRLGAETDYTVGRLQVARIQALTAAANATSKTPYLFGRVDAQVASGALIGSEQLAVGGTDTVRGYPERDVAGDHGLVASLEYRTPIYAGLFQGGEALPTAKDQLQFVLFVDGAHLTRDEEDSSLPDAYTLLSVGLGLRLSYGTHAELRLDYGFPLEDTDTTRFQDEVDGSGRLHFSTRIQF